MKNEFIKSKGRYQEAFAAAMAYSIAFALYFWFNTFYGYWIATMISTMFALSSKGSVIKRSYDRMFGTFLGIILTFCYIGTFMYSDYRWVYFLPVVWFLIFYFHGILGSPALPALATTMFIPIVDDITEGVLLSLDRVVIQRILFTVIAIIIGLICEYIIYKNAASNSGKMKSNTRLLFKNMGNILKESALVFTKDQNLQNKYTHTLLETMDSISSLESIYSNLKYELKFSGQQFVLKEIFQKIQRINIHLRKILCYSNHSKIDTSYLSEEKLDYFCNNLNYKFQNITDYFYGKKDNTTSELLTYLVSTQQKFRIEPTYFYLKELFYLSLIVDSFAALISNRKSYNEKV